MPIYLDEDMVGQDPNEICFPHLLLCMGVVVLMTDGSLIGAHFTIPDTEAQVGAEMAAQITAHTGAHGTAMHQLYCSGDLPLHCGHHGGMDIQNKAGMLNFHGDAYSFDTSAIKPKHGTFVSVQSNGPNINCTIYYKRDEKVNKLYDRPLGHTTPTISIIKGSITDSKTGALLMPAAVKVQPAQTVGLTAPIHKLHTAKFTSGKHLLRIQHVVIP